MLTVATGLRAMMSRRPPWKVHRADADPVLARPDARQRVLLGCERGHDSDGGIFGQPREERVHGLADGLGLRPVAPRRTAATSGGLAVGDVVGHVVGHVHPAQDGCRIVRSATATMSVRSREGSWPEFSAC
ncbi:hypothetical protein AC230_00900 [Streptomyces caatingaensis]|uniref:Uncharacterized protein n=1 Tax=Streptomyces caatingaensis TaxID=1678637 RepID=A0A0K9XIV8_9ACTN|nr:hypothetical protein AC230_00900 [Streptomyces caatingaensis]